jgi:hypothetical protein
MSNSKGAELIAVERQRQIDFEGWTLEHDDGHSRGELATAAACYAIHPLDRSNNVGGFGRSLPLVPHALWPWDRESWKPVGAIHMALERGGIYSPVYARGDEERARIRELVKAGALILAEIDRLLRRSGDGRS